ncbi:unnamed protein product [Onchocerca flexuosa]|uniref:Succinate dehydrogenase assembly factor 3 n=1 Tax=Onchocerca flexuosa TaxID=387005 RepID=A0A183I6P0_9BILA|nr:unnamed protein product [Onchocerca flexuosa]
MVFSAKDVSRCWDLTRITNSGVIIGECIFVKLHYGLPKEMRIIGDRYIKDEFRRHKNVSSEQALIFLKEWKVNILCDVISIFY